MSYAYSNSNFIAYLYIHFLTDLDMHILREAVTILNSHLLGLQLHLNIVCMYATLELQALSELIFFSLIGTQENGFRHLFGGLCI